MSSDCTMQLVVFSLGEEEYALPITHVQEIIRYTEPRSVASHTPWVKGVISLRGKIVPVYDLALRLGLTVDAVASKIVMVESADDMAGVIVGDVEEVLTLTNGDLDEVPAAGAACIQAIAKVGDRLVVLLDPAGIFAAEPTAPAGATAGACATAGATPTARATAPATAGATARAGATAPVPATAPARATAPAGATARATTAPAPAPAPASTTGKSKAAGGALATAA